MDINEELIRRRTAARQYQAAQQARQAHARVESAVALQAVATLGATFVRWAQLSGIEQDELTWRTVGTERQIRKGRGTQVSSPNGWRLTTVGTLTGNCDSGFCGRNHSHSISLTVSPTGVLSWSQSSDRFTPPDLTPEYVQGLIVEYMLRQERQGKRIAPWPSSTESTGMGNPWLSEMGTFRDGGYAATGGQPVSRKRRGHRTAWQRFLDLLKY